MDTLEEFMELESLLPTMDDITWRGFIIDDNEEDIWQRIIRYVDGNLETSLKDSSYQQKFFQYVCKHNCIKNEKLSKYFDTYRKSCLKFWSVYPLQALIIIFENKLQGLFNEYFEKHQETINFWQQWFDETIEAAKNVVKNDTSIGEREWETRHFVNFFKLESGSIKCKIYKRYTINLALELSSKENMSTKCQEYVAWCWKYYQKMEEVEQQLSTIRSNPPCGECYSYIE